MMKMQQKLILFSMFCAMLGTFEVIHADTDDSFISERNVFIESRTDDVVISADTAGTNGKINIKAGTTMDAADAAGEIGIAAENDLILKSVNGNIIFDGSINVNNVSGTDAAAASNDNGGNVIVEGGDGDGPGNGGMATVTGGAGGATGDGGNLLLTGGNGGATFGNGGSVSVSAGTVIGTTGEGANVTITASAGVGTGAADGDITLTAGGTTGLITLQAGSTDGDIALTAGNTNGDVTVTAGNDVMVTPSNNFTVSATNGASMTTTNNNASVTSTNGAVALTAGTDVTVTPSNNFTVNATNDVDITGANSVDITASGATSNITLTAGATSGDINVVAQGQNIDLTALIVHLLAAARVQPVTSSGTICFSNFNNGGKSYATFDGAEITLTLDRNAGTLVAATSGGTVTGNPVKIGDTNTITINTPTPAEQVTVQWLSTGVIQVTSTS